MIALNVIPYIGSSVTGEGTARDGTYDEGSDQLEKEVLGVVIGAVEGEEDDFGDELDGSGLNQDAQNRHEITLTISAIARGTLISLPDAERHKASRETRLNDGDGVERCDPMKKTRIEDSGIRILRWIQTADRITGNWGSKLQCLVRV